MDEQRDRDSGVAISFGGAISPEDLDVLHACDQILNAVTTLGISLEFVTDHVAAEGKTAMDDARTSLDRIEGIVTAIQRVFERPRPRSSLPQGATKTAP